MFSLAINFSLWLHDKQLGLGRYKGAGINKMNKLSKYQSVYLFYFYQPVYCQAGITAYFGTKASILLS